MNSDGTRATKTEGFTESLWMDFEGNHIAVPSDIRGEDLENYRISNEFGKGVVYENYATGFSLVYCFLKVKARHCVLC